MLAPEQQLLGRQNDTQQVINMAGGMQLFGSAPTSQQHYYANWLAGEPPPSQPVQEVGGYEAAVAAVETSLQAYQETGNGSGAHQLLAVEQNPYAIVNVTREYPFEYALIMFGYIMPFVLIITLITNLLVIVVLSQRHMRTPTNIVLMTMAIVDIGTIASPSPWYLYIYTFGNHDKPLFPPATCYAHYVMTDVIPIFLHTSSIWLALLLASQRYIYVCHPTMARTWCTVPRVKRAILTILLVAFLHQLSHFFDNVYKPTKIEHNHEIQDACRNEMATWVSDIGDNYYYLTYYTFRIFFVFIIPCVALLTLNVLLFRALRRAEKKRTELLKTKFKLVGVIDPSNNHTKLNCETGTTINRASRFGGRANNNTNNNSAATFEASSYAIAAAANAVRQQKAAECAGRELFVRATPTQAATTTTTPLPLESADEQQIRSPPAAAEAATLIKSDDNHSCPTESEISEALEGVTGPQRDLETGRQSSLSTGSGNEQDEQVEEEEEEGESTCAECAECAAQATGSGPNSTAGGCRRCSADELATRDCRPRHVRHQPISQCSSVLGNNERDNQTIRRTNDYNEGEEQVGSSAVNNELRPIELGGATPDGATGCNGTAAAAGEHWDDLDGADEEQNLSIGSTGDSESQPRSINSTKTPSGNVVGKRLMASESQPNGSAAAAAVATSEVGRLIKSSSSSAESRLACSCLAAAAVAPARSLRRVRLLGTRSKQPLAPPSSSALACGPPAKRRATPTSPPAISSTTTTTTTTSAMQVNNNQQQGGKRASCTQAMGAFLRVHDQVQGGQQRAPGNQERGRSNSVARLSCRLKSPSFASSTGRGSRATLLMAGACSSGGNEAAFVTSSANGGGGGAGGNVGQMTAAPSHTSQSGRTMDSNRTTLMLIVVVTVFLVVEVPVAAVTITHVVLNLFEVFRNVDLNNTLNYIKLFTNFFIMISYSINFTIYCSMSKKFRETFRDLFLCGNSAEQKRAQRIMYQTQAQHSQYVTNTNHHQHFVSPTSFIGGAGGELNGHEQQQQQRYANSTTMAAAGGGLVAQPDANADAQKCIATTKLAGQAKLKVVPMKAHASKSTKTLAEATDGLQRNSALQSDYLATATSARLLANVSNGCNNGHTRRQSPHNSSAVTFGWSSSSDSWSSSSSSSSSSSASASASPSASASAPAAPSSTPTSPRLNGVSSLTSKQLESADCLARHLVAVSTTTSLVNGRSLKPNKGEPLRSNGQPMERVQECQL